MNNLNEVLYMNISDQYRVEEHKSLHEKRWEESKRKATDKILGFSEESMSFPRLRPKLTTTLEKSLRRVIGYGVAPTAEKSRSSMTPTIGMAYEPSSYTGIPTQPVSSTGA